MGSSSPDSTAPSQDDAEAIAQIAFKGAPNKEEKTEVRVLSGRFLSIIYVTYVVNTAQFIVLTRTTLYLLF